jgi:hypothetical protein
VLRTLLRTRPLLGACLAAGAAGLALLASTGAASAMPAAPPAAQSPAALSPAASSPAAVPLGVTAGPVPAISSTAGKLNLSAGAPYVRSACGQALPGYASCAALVNTMAHWNGATWAAGNAPAARPRTAPPASSKAAMAPGTPPAPFMAADLRSAYRLPSALLGGRQVIAIVDAFDDPNAAADLAVYRQANNLPPCDAMFSCFTKVNQDGQAGPLPPTDPNWALEESLDLDMASAICPNCQIVLVEANDNSQANLSLAEDTAARLGATEISNSWGGPEFTGQDDNAKDFNHPGIAITVSSGDDGFETGVASFPATLGTVTAVGGTTLYPAANSRGWDEAAWGSTALGAGSGCSAYEPKPAWQHDSLCPTRAIADVSAVADPSTPVAVYDTFQITGGGGWIAVGGTSVAAPIIAGVYALAGNADTIGTGASHLYAHSRALFDVVPHPDQVNINSGSNGVCGSGYLCNAAAGYDGPTGNGTPDGIGAF